VQTQRIAIIGLGRIGSAFLREMLDKRKHRIELIGAVERAETPGKAHAIAAGVRMLELDDIIALGGMIDVIFDLTGDADLRKTLRDKLASVGNRHTVIAPESILHVIWSFIGAEELPAIEGRVLGY
jgi:predicted dinucleotide-utilizing enzyme